MTRSPLRILSCLVLAFVLFAAACGSTDSDSTASYAEDVASFDTEESLVEASPSSSDASDDDEAAAGSFAVSSEQRTAAEPIATGAAANEAVSQLPDTGREIVYTADLDLGTSDVTIATRDAIRAVEIRGGFLFSQDTAGGVNGYSTLVFKVPPDQFQAVLNELGSVGAVRSQSVSAEDVTAVVVDLQSRINTSEASVLRLRALLDNATDIDVIAELENQLLGRETALEQLRGRLRVIQRQVDFATVTVRVTELLNHPAMAVELASYPGHDAGFTCQDRPMVTTAESESAFTLCWLVTNVGDTVLTDVTINEPALAGLEADLLVVEGLAARVDPGETVVLAYEFETTQSLRIRSRITATPVTLDGTTTDESITAASRNLRLDVFEPSGDLPSFGDVLASSWNALKVMAIVVALVLVAVAPFLAIALPAGWLILRAVRRKREPGWSAAPATAPPPPPAAPEPDTQELATVE